MRFLNAIFSFRVTPLLLLVTADALLAQSNPVPYIPAIEATNYMGVQVVVTDRVVQVVMRPTVVLLNLNKRYPESPLTCAIRGSDTNKFPDIESFVGKSVEVRGRIIDYQGRPEIILTSTNQIRALKAGSTTANPPLSSLIPPAPAAVSIEPATATAPPEERKVETKSRPERAVWLIGGTLGGLLVVMGFLSFLFWWRSRPANPSPAPVTALAKRPEEPRNESVSVAEWKQRALVAEAMAGQQGQMLREKIMPELAEFAKQSLVQGLYAQRNALIERQIKAQEAVAEMERRLTALQVPLQERVRAYEKRVAELEKEVESQGEEVRELTRATLDLVRRKLQDERELARMRNPLN